MLLSLNQKQWHDCFAVELQQQALDSLEKGQILYLPQLAFALNNDEQAFLSPTYADPHTKNISYHAAAKKLWGVRYLTDAQHGQLKNMLERFSAQAIELVRRLLPRYQAHLMVGRTSFRPVEISKRKTSYRKDDKRLHVDAFPSAPNQGKRILRVFCNINPTEDRIWRVGEHFEKVAHTFLPQVNRPLPGWSRLLRLLKITKSYRSSYDHMMLQIHNRMKADENYQQNAAQQEVRFSPGSSWIVQTDHVSHAAMRGQYVLEQTFYLPIHAMQAPELSPLRVLENLLQRPLV